jgi:Rieske Fe-S protein
MEQPHFHHLFIEVSDLERSERFYGETMGLDRMGRDWWPDEGPTSTLKTDQGQYVVLVQTPQVKPDGIGVHTNFMVSTEDYGAIHERLQAAGCYIPDLRADLRPVGELSDNFTDPDGHLLQITAISPAAFEVPAAKRGKIVAGALADFPLGSVTRNREGKFYLVHTAEGFLALNEVCTHQRCNVVYQPEHYRFYCPCHYNKFTRTGEHLGHIAGTPPLHAYTIEFVDGQIVVDTDRSHPRRPDEARTMVPGPDEVARPGS